MWGGIVGGHVLGPYFFDGNVNAERYLDFLTNELQYFIDNLPLVIVQRMWLQQDGAPPHYGRLVRTYLNAEFHDRWIANQDRVQ